MRPRLPHALLPALLLGCGSPSSHEPLDSDSDADSGDAPAEPTDDTAPVDTQEQDTDTGRPLPRVFLTSTSIGADMGGISGADAHCMGDERAPSGVTFKALIVSSERYACADAPCADPPQQLDWVLTPQMRYTLLDGTPFLETNEHGLVDDYPLPTSLGEGRNFWAGLHEDWTRHEQHCDDWTSSDEALQGRVGWGDGVNERWIQGGNFTCDRTARLVCVEQL